MGNIPLGLLALLHFAVKAHEWQGGTLAAVTFAATVCEGIHITQLTLSHLPWRYWRGSLVWSKSLSKLPAKWWLCPADCCTAVVAVYLWHKYNEPNNARPNRIEMMTSMLQTSSERLQYYFPCRSLETSTFLWVDEENFTLRRKQKEQLHFISFLLKPDSNAFKGKWNTETNSLKRDEWMVH